MFAFNWKSNKIYSLLQRDQVRGPRYEVGTIRVIKASHTGGLVVKKQTVKKSLTYHVESRRRDRTLRSPEPPLLSRG